MTSALPKAMMMSRSTLSMPANATLARRKTMQDSSIHALVAAVDGEVSDIPSFMFNDEGKASIVRLMSAWKSLVDGLALPVQPTRVCPTCGKLGMEKATVCGYCWTKVSPAGAPT